MPKLEIKLKQHTPIIHFQHDQEGATLRATELKPKLDKYLIKYVFDNDFEKYKTFLVAYKPEKKEKDYGDKKAFDYKVKIQPCNSKHFPIDLSHTLFFGNMGKDENEKIQFKMCEETTLEVFSFNEKILDKILQCFAQFMAVTNFGTRQNKGFGSFYPVSAKLNETYTDTFDFLSELKKIRKNFLLINYERNFDYKQQLEDIYIIYSLMKTGVNYPDHPKIKRVDKNGKAVLNKHGKPIYDPDRTQKGERASYHKSFLFQYMAEKYGNEKRFIKENFFKPFLRIPDDGQEKRYIRSLLGVCDNIDFKDDRNGKIEFKSVVKGIDRFKSPITFKIIDKYVAIIPEDLPDEIFKNPIKFKLSHEFRDRNRILHTTEKEILAPNKEMFDLTDFLFSFAKYFNDLPESKIVNTFENKINKARKHKIQKITGVSHD